MDFGQNGLLAIYLVVLVSPIRPVLLAALAVDSKEAGVTTIKFAVADAKDISTNHGLALTEH